jgi:hypothetical protein
VLGVPTMVSKLPRWANPSAVRGRRRLRAIHADLINMLKQQMLAILLLVASSTAVDLSRGAAANDASARPPNATVVTLDTVPGFGSGR